MRIEAADLTDLQPAEYRADLVLLLLENRPVLGIVVEVQLARDEDKPFVWPVYAAGLRARVRCPVCLLVVTAQEAVARRAARPIELGGGNRFVPLVLGPSGVPEITDPEVARADPELSVLSAIAHGQDADVEKSLAIAVAAAIASVGLDADRSTLIMILCTPRSARRRERRFRRWTPPNTNTRANSHDATLHRERPREEPRAWSKDAPSS